MSDQELSELLAHPRVRAHMERIAEDAAARVYAAMGHSGKPAAEGDLNYADASAFIGCPVRSISAYLSRGQLLRGKLPHTVSFTSCEAFKRNYKPIPSRRIAE